MAAKCPIIWLQSHDLKSATSRVKEIGLEGTLLTGGAINELALAAEELCKDELVIVISEPLTKTEKTQITVDISPLWLSIDKDTATQKDISGDSRFAPKQVRKYIEAEIGSRVLKGQKYRLKKEMGLFV